MTNYFFLFFLLLLFGITVNAQTKKEPFLTRPLANENIKNVDVKTSAGSISVTGVATSEARVEVFINANNRDGGSLSKEEIQKRLEQDYDLNISVNNNKLSAIAKSKEKNIDWRRALNISFIVYVPKDVTTELNTSGGGITLYNLAGSHNFSTSGGGLRIENVSGNIRGRTSGGGIDLKNSQGDIDVRTSGGGINARNSTGQLTLSTSGGSLNLSELNGVIKANTSGGSINGNNIGGELITHTSGGSIKLTDLTASLETSTSGGNIDVSIKEFGKYVRINNSGGDIDLQLPLNKGLDLRLSARKIKAPSLSNFSGTIDDEEIDGKLNGGGVPVSVRAGSGRIYLSMK